MPVKILNIPQGKILIAVSGGVDSCVLLNLLVNQVDKKDLIVAHVNHNIRGKESDEDELFVKNLAEAYGLKFYSTKFKISPKSEEEARDKRYEFLFSLIKKYDAKHLALAHHQSDQVETLMLQMTRGTYAFSPMKKIDAFKWRPLLDVSKQEILEFAQKNNLEWREDRTNKDNSFSRNRIRNKIIPELKEMNSNFEEVFLQFALGVSAKNADIDVYAKSLIDDLSEEFDNKRCISAKRLLQLPRFLQSSIIKKFKPGLYKKHIDEVLDMINKGAGKKEKHGFSLDKGIVFFS